jgi:pimeloyl-ACP methyl ester carboxylesterase
MVTTERPGFGRSTPLRGRGFTEHADDLAAVLDAIGIQRVPVIGGSGAAPHILTFLARHPDRVEAATIVVGTAPMTDAEVEQMIPINRESHRLAVAGDREGLTDLLSPIRTALLAEPLAAFVDVMASAPASDHAVMCDPGWQRGMERAIRDALAAGIEGWVDEGMAIDSRWDEVDLPAVRSSITWWHGDADSNCPLSATQRLVSALPTARLELRPDAGHLLGHHLEGHILDELLARA